MSAIEIKICKNCRHYDRDFRFCIRGKRQVGTDPVDGSPVHKYTVLNYASSERESWWPWACGKKGRHFAARTHKEESK